jgi:hypothetical protein
MESFSSTPPSSYSKLDYHEDEDDAVVVKAIFLGRGLVPGYKAYLDDMQPTWRQYIHDNIDIGIGIDDIQKEEEEEDGEQSFPEELFTINSNVIASGCHHHANQYTSLFKKLITKGNMARQTNRAWRSPS